jgi:hypothetical protein
VYKFSWKRCEQISIELDSSVSASLKNPISRKSNNNNKSEAYKTFIFRPDFHLAMTLKDLNILLCQDLVYQVTKGGPEKYNYDITTSFG